MSIVAGVLLAYGAAVIFLQLEVPAKLIRGAMGYGGWLWGGANDLPTAWNSPTDPEAPLRSLYTLLSLKQPILPWLAWVAGCVLLLWTSAAPAQHSTRPNTIAADVPAQSRARTRARLLAGLAIVGGLVAVVAAWILRAGNLLPFSDGTWTGSNFDEMVYYTQAELLTRGALAYRDVFMAHPPGVVLAFAPAMAFEKAWGGAAAFVAARQWLLVYSLLAVPLAWFVARKLGGYVSAALAALVLALDGKAAFAAQSDRQLPNVGVLETLVNVTALGALALYLYAPASARTRRWWLLGAGALAGISALCKVPGVALLLALLLYALARKEVRDAGWMLLGAVVGAGLLAIPFFVASPGQMVRQVLFFQLLRPNEVRAGIDQAARIASYQEAQLTLLAAGVGLLCLTWLLWRDSSAAPGADTFRWALPVLWAAPIIATFTLSRSYHSQYYTQLVPPLALIAGSIGAAQLWRRTSVVKAAVAVVAGIIALPLMISQWRAAATPARDDVYKPTGAALASGVKPGQQAMAYDPGYTFAAGLPPARLPAQAGGDYIVDTAGYTVYSALGLDRRGWGDLAGAALRFDRRRDEEEILSQPAAQAALLAGAVGADTVVLDQKIALPKLSAQSVRLLEGLSTAQQDISFARLLQTSRPASKPLSAFGLDLDAAFIAPLRQDLQQVATGGEVTAHADQALQIGLYWRPRDYLSANMRVVARLVDSSGGNARQVDTEPSEGTEHTQGWRPGLLYPDIRNIPLQGLAQGPYSVHVRVYDPASNAASEEIVLDQFLNIQ